MSPRVRLSCVGFVAITNFRSVGLVFKVTGRLEVPQMHQVSRLELRIHLIDLPIDDKHNMQLDPKYIPTPTINDRLSSSFRLSTSVQPA